MTVFRDYDQEQLDRQYDQRAWAPNAAAVIRGYSENSDRVRARIGEPQVLSYGMSNAETLDLYRCGRPNAPLQVFIHGGAWRLLGKRDSAFPAEAFVSAGAHFVALDFALLPVVNLADMASQVRGAIAWLRRNAGAIDADPARIYLSGHSSGGHLAALAAVTDWSQYDLPADTVRGALCASGIYDLRPVRLSARNDYVRLDETSEHALSPIRHLGRRGCNLVVARAEFDSDEFRRQAAEFAAASGAPLIEGKGLNHFEIAATLADPDGVLGAAALRQMGLSPPSRRA